ncbi:hypothetical protein PsorP6_000795 [Peronosclerospora sorghi]|uniref:Uncharacterized protein n=1 Tax=Peronosclerospora sorghi TaxID=230839 RepID=A0ACC0WQ70_9STRA|nr:hypothetical protein PsorP6_000795 [Peronosclerospora sorghi]
MRRAINIDGNTSPLFVSFENNSLSDLYKLETLALPFSPDKKKLAILCCMSAAIFPFMDSGRSSPRAKIASISSSVIIDPRALKILSAPKRTIVISSSFESFRFCCASRPCCIIAALRYSFLSARSTIISSTVPLVIKQNTRKQFSTGQYDGRNPCPANPPEGSSMN